MASKELNDKELDKMIDRSVDDMKKENATGRKETREEKHAKKKEDKKESKPVKEKDDLNQPKQAIKPGKEKDGLDKSAKTIKPVEGYDPWQVLHYPHLAEKSMNMVELENKLIFVVRRNAKKEQVKEAVEKGFGVKVLAVNIMITRKGHKKAYIKLAPGYSAADIATRLGMI